MVKIAGIRSMYQTLKLQGGNYVKKKTLVSKTVLLNQRCAVFRVMQ